MKRLSSERSELHLANESLNKEIQKMKNPNVELDEKKPDNFVQKLLHRRKAAEHGEKVSTQTKMDIA